MNETPLAAADEPPAWAAAHAFVVQFAAASADGDGFRGRVEHVVSGRSGRFESPEQLLAFCRQVLASTHLNPRST